MLVESVVIPFLLGFNVILPLEERDHYDPEYSYELNKTTVVLREPLQITQLTSTVTCHTFIPEHLHCFLHNIKYLTTFTNSNLNVSYVASEESIKSEHWFQIKFNRNGVQKVLVNETTDEHIKSIILDIVNQFNIGVEPSVSSSLFRTRFTVQEKVPIGSCVTTYALNATYSKEIETRDSTRYREDAEIIMYALKKIESNSYPTGTYFMIEKNRKDCDYSQSFVTFINGMEVAKYEHVIEAFNNNVHKNVKLVTTMHVQLPADPWNPLGSPVFQEITQLNLTRVNSPKTKIF